MSTLKTFNLQHPSSAVINATLESNGAVTAANIFNGNSGITIAANGNVSISSLGLVRTTIDTNGYVLRPYQPAFSARATGTTQTAGTIQFNAVDLNVSSSFNASTYRFTAPVAGNYFFCLTSIGTTGATTSISLHKNGTRVSGIGWGGITSSAESGATINAIINLAVNDYVTAVAGTSAYNNGYNNFSGFLLG